LIQYLSAASRDEPELTSVALPGTGFFAREFAPLCEHGDRERGVK